MMNSKIKIQAQMSEPYAWVYLFICLPTEGMKVLTLILK